MLAGQDGPGGIVFNDYPTTYLVGSIALAVILFDGGLRTRLSVFRGVLAPSTAAGHGRGGRHRRGDRLAACVGARPRSGRRPAARRDRRLDRRGGGVLPAPDRRPPAAAAGSARRSRSSPAPTTRSRSSSSIVLTEFILAGGGIAGLGARGRARARGGRSARPSALAGGFALVAMLNRLPMPGGLHPLFVVAGAITLCGAHHARRRQRAARGLRRRPRHGEPPDPRLPVDRRLPRRGDLALPDRDVPGARPPRDADDALATTRPRASSWRWSSPSSRGRSRSGSASAPFGFARNEKLFISWVGLRGAVSIFLAAIPTLAGVPNAPAYFNIAFFVVLFSMLVQGSTLTAAARRLGVALKQATPRGQPGRDRHPRPDRAGDRRLPGDRRQP